MAKKPSFNFGANVKKKGSGKPQTKGERQYHAVAYRQGNHPRQTGKGGGS
jgi:hypothetical protein